MSPEMRIAPITPEQAREEHYIPDEVIEVINEELILWAGERVEIPLRSIVSRAINKGLDRKDIRWFDIISRYTQAGWKVDKRVVDYDDRDEIYYIFSCPKG